MYDSNAVSGQFCPPQASPCPFLLHWCLRPGESKQGISGLRGEECQSRELESRTSLAPDSEHPPQVSAGCDSPILARGHGTSIHVWTSDDCGLWSWDVCSPGPSQPNYNLSGLSTSRIFHPCLWGSRTLAKQRWLESHTLALTLLPTLPLTPPLGIAFLLVSCHAHRGAMRLATWEAYNLAQHFLGPTRCSGDLPNL